jgi:hypothetical protein
VCELKAKSEENGEDTLDKRLAIVEQTKVGGFVLEIDGDGAVVPCPLGCVAHVSPPSHRVSYASKKVSKKLTLAAYDRVFSEG